MDAFRLLGLFVMYIVLCQVLVVHGDSLSRRLRCAAAGREQLKDTDMRVKLTNEALLGIRVLKYNVWEEPTIQRAPPTLPCCLAIRQRQRCRGNLFPGQR